jgi:hypothetical protein
MSSALGNNDSKRVSMSWNSPREELPVLSNVDPVRMQHIREWIALHSVDVLQRCNNNNISDDHTLLKWSQSICSYLSESHQLTSRTEQAAYAGVALAGVLSHELLRDSISPAARQHLRRVTLALMSQGLLIQDAWLTHFANQVSSKLRSFECDSNQHNGSAQHADRAVVLTDEVLVHLDLFFLRSGDNTTYPLSRWNDESISGVVLSCVECVMECVACSIAACASLLPDTIEWIQACNAPNSVVSTLEHWLRSNAVCIVAVCTAAVTAPMRVRAMSQEMQRLSALTTLQVGVQSLCLAWTDMLDSAGKGQFPHSIDNAGLSTYRPLDTVTSFGLVLEMQFVRSHIMNEATLASHLCHLRHVYGMSYTDLYSATLVASVRYLFSVLEEAWHRPINSMGGTHGMKSVSSTAVSGITHNMGNRSNGPATPHSSDQSSGDGIPRSRDNWFVRVSFLLAKLPRVIALIEVSRTDAHKVDEAKVRSGNADDGDSATSSKANDVERALATVTAFPSLALRALPIQGAPHCRYRMMDLIADSFCVAIDLRTSAPTDTIQSTPLSGARNCVVQLASFDRLHRLTSSTMVVDRITQHGAQHIPHPTDPSQPGVHCTTVAALDDIIQRLLDAPADQINPESVETVVRAAFSPFPSFYHVQRAVVRRLLPRILDPSYGASPVLLERVSKLLASESAVTLVNIHGGIATIVTCLLQLCDYYFSSRLGPTAVVGSRTTASAGTTFSSAPLSSMLHSVNDRNLLSLDFFTRAIGFASYALYRRMSTWDELRAVPNKVMPTSSLSLALIFNNRVLDAVPGIDARSPAHKLVHVMRRTLASPEIANNMAEHKQGALLYSARKLRELAAEPQYQNVDALELCIVVRNVLMDLFAPECVEALVALNAYNSLIAAFPFLALPILGSLEARVHIERKQSRVDVEKDLLVEFVSILASMSSESSGNLLRNSHFPRAHSILTHASSNALVPNTLNLFDRISSKEWRVVRTQQSVSRIPDTTISRNIQDTMAQLFKELLMYYVARPTTAFHFVNTSHLHVIHAFYSLLQNGRPEDFGLLIMRLLVMANVTPIASMTTKKPTREPTFGTLSLPFNDTGNSWTLPKNKDMDRNVERRLDMRTSELAYNIIMYCGGADLCFHFASNLMSLPAAMATISHARTRAAQSAIAMTVALCVSSVISMDACSTSSSKRDWTGFWTGISELLRSAPNDIANPLHNTAHLTAMYTLSVVDAPVIANAKFLSRDSAMFEILVSGLGMCRLLPIACLDFTSATDRYIAWKLAHSNYSEKLADVPGMSVLALANSSASSVIGARPGSRELDDTFEHDAWTLDYLVDQLKNIEWHTS